MGVATVAILFTDVAGSTESADKLGPVAAGDLRRSHFESLRKALRSHDGTEVKTTGDGLMVVFPNASEAVACASTMQRATQRTTSDAWSRPRIGVSLGEATSEDGDWYGMPVVRAARLCATAEPGQVLVDSFVAALAEHADAEFEPVGELTLKGIGQPVPAFELIRLDRTTAFPLQRSFVPPPGSTFVGRRAHLAALREAWEAADGEHVTKLVLMAGEPGAGKTSIAAAFGSTLHREQGALALFGRCDDGVGLAYQPFAQALGHYVRHADEQVLEASVEAHGGELSRLVPQLDARLGSVPPPVVGDPASEQLRLFAAVHGLLLAAGETASIVLVIDDLHWATAPTLQLLTYLLNEDPSPPLLIVATYRDTELARTHPLTDTLAELRRLPSVERLRVEGLEVDETEALVEALTGHAAGADGGALARILHARTEGNPFFAVEVLHHLAESGALAFDDGLATTGDLDAASLPEGVKEVVGRRLRRLPEPTNEALGVAAIAGLEFDAAVIAHVVDTSVPELLDALDQAVSAGILRPAGHPYRFAFTHALIRTTLEDEAGVARRVHLHGRVAEAIEAVYGTQLEAWLTDLAHHHAEAAYPGRTAPAVEFALRAAAQARVMAATDEAVAHLERGLSAARLGGAPPDEVARLLVDLAETTAIDSPVRARQYATEASAVAEAAGLRSTVGDVAAAMWSAVNTTNAGSVGGDRWLIEVCERALAEPDALAPAVRSRVLAMHVLLGGWAGDDVDPAEADEAVELASETGDAVSIITAALSQVMSRGFASRGIVWPRFLENVRRGLEVTDDQHLRGMAAVFVSWGAPVMGDIETWRWARTEVDRAATVLGSPRMRSWSAWLRAMEALRVGAWDDVVEATTEARDVTVDRTIGDNMWQLHVGTAMLNQGRAADLLPVFDEQMIAGGPAGEATTVYRALVEALAGDHTGARRTLSTVRDERLLERGTFRLVGTGAAAWAAAVADDRASVDALTELLAPFGGLIASGSMVEIGAVDRLLAMLAALDGRHDEADALFRSGLALEVTFGGDVMAAHTRYWWARCLAERNRPGDRERARELLTECTSTAERLSMRQLADEAGTVVSTLT
jgi:class 3 adenylate cyclase